MLQHMNHYLAAQDNRASSIILWLYHLGIQPFCHHSKEEELLGNPTLAWNVSTGKWFMSLLFTTHWPEQLICPDHTQKTTGKCSSWCSNKERKTRYWWAQVTTRVEHVYTREDLIRKELRTGWQSWTMKKWHVQYVGIFQRNRIMIVAVN